MTSTSGHRARHPASRETVRRESIFIAFRRHTDYTRIPVCTSVSPSVSAPVRMGPPKPRTTGEDITSRLSLSSSPSHSYSRKFTETSFRYYARAFLPIRPPFSPPPPPTAAPLWSRRASVKSRHTSNIAEFRIGIRHGTLLRRHDKQEGGPPGALARHPAVKPIVVLL